MFLGPLVRLESFVREAFAQRQHAVGVFFDPEKAYESTWKFGSLIFGSLIFANLCKFAFSLPSHPEFDNYQLHVRHLTSYKNCNTEKLAL